MKNLTLTAILLYILSSPVAFAEATASSTSSSITQTTIGDVNGNILNTPAQSTTYTTTSTTTINSNDDKIVSAVYAKYAKDPALIGTTLTVNSQNGIVSVSGTVTAQSQADEASIAAKSVPGVQDVRSTIKVTTNPDLNKPAKIRNY